MTTEIRVYGALAVVAGVGWWLGPGAAALVAFTGWAVHFALFVRAVFTTPLKED